MSLSCRALHVLPARLSLQAPSSQACHLLEARTIMFWTLRFCIPLLVRWDSGVGPCMHAATSFLDLQGRLRGFVEHLLEHLHPLLFPRCSVTLGCFWHSNTSHLSACSFVMGPGVPTLAVSSWVLGSQSLAVFLSSRPLGTCFIHHIQ